MRFRPRDHERFIGGYDPEHEMPDPDRGPRDRWQSEAYRYGARDSRFMYRWNPDRFIDRNGEEWIRRRALERDIQPRDRYDRDRDREYYSRGYPRPYEDESRWAREEWEREYENEYWGRPEDPTLRYERDRWRRY